MSLPARPRRGAGGPPAAAMVILAALGGYGLAASPLFAIDRVAVLGVDPAEAEGIRARVWSAVGRNLLEVDVRALERLALQSPRVARASVLRRWPSTLEVRVTPRHPVAQFPYGGTFYEVDGQGRVLGPAPAPGALPVITGALVTGEAVTVGERAPPALAEAAKAAEAAAGVLGDALVEVQADRSTGQLRLRLGGGSEVVWGSVWGDGGQADAHRRRAELLRAVWPRLPRTGRWQLDLSQGDRAVLRPGGPSGDAQAQAPW